MMIIIILIPASGESGRQPKACRAPARMPASRTPCCYYHNFIVLTDIIMVMINDRTNINIITMILIFCFCFPRTRQPFSDLQHVSMQGTRALDPGSVRAD